MCSSDLPTVAEITGADLPQNKIDGVSLLPLLKGDENASPRTTILYYYQQNSLEAVQKDYWKLVLPHSGRSYTGIMPGKDGWPGKYLQEVIISPELYDLRRDPGERYNVAAMYPEKVEELNEVASSAREDLGDDITGFPGPGRRKPRSEERRVG